MRVLADYYLESSLFWFIALAGQDPPMVFKIRILYDETKCIMRMILCFYIKLFREFKSKYLWLNIILSLNEIL